VLAAHGGDPARLESLVHDLQQLREEADRVAFNEPSPDALREYRRIIREFTENTASVRDGDGRLMHVEPREGESFDQTLRRFKTSMDKSGILSMLVASWMRCVRCSMAAPTKRSLFSAEPSTASRSSPSAWRHLVPPRLRCREI
jgi:ribosomal protein S21